MPNLEKKCKWYFGPQARGNEQGPNNPTALTFKGTKYHSLIRESIQNSLDAVRDKSKPVTVSFKYSEFYGSEYREFFKLKDHIQGCLDKYPNDENGVKLFEPMLSYIADLPSDQKIGYIKVTDSNTTGMDYDANNPKSPFNAFISEGIASKPNGAGGSFGFGKAVFWMNSKISTIFVSSKTEDGNNYFVGQSKLCTHYLNKGEDLSPKGLYSTDGNGFVITDDDAIPDEFKTKEIGTSVFILGADYINDAIRTELVSAVLRNFWMALYQEKLIVVIDGERIAKDNLQTLMEQFFDDNDTGSVRDADKIHLYNPRPYFELVVKADEGGDDDYKYIEDTIDVDGELWPVKLYIHKCEVARGYYEFMRSPLMTVYLKRRSGTWKNTEGVFICDSKEGNDFLREMEDCSHDSWTIENYKARENKNVSKARKAINAIEDFIEHHIIEELQRSSLEKEKPVGLEDLLYISTPQDLRSSGNDDDIVDPNSIIDIKKRKTDRPPRTKPTILKRKETKAVADPNGRLRANSSRKKKRQHPKGPIPIGNIKQPFEESTEGKKGIYAIQVDVAYRTWSEIDEDGIVWHVIKLFSDEQIDNAIIQVYGVDDDGNTLGLDIKESPGYKIRVGEEFNDNTDFDDNQYDSLGNRKQLNNAVSGVKINAGIPKVIKIRFNSDIKYSLRINADKIVEDENN